MACTTLSSLLPCHVCVCARAHGGGVRALGLIFDFLILSMCVVFFHGFSLSSPSLFFSDNNRHHLTRICVRSLGFAHRNLISDLQSHRREISLSNSSTTFMRDHSHELVSFWGMIMDECGDTGVVVDAQV